MKKLTLKITVGLLTLVIGIFVVWTSGILQTLFPQPGQGQLSPTLGVTVLASPPIREESGKIVLLFKGFELFKDWSAKFEIVNYTSKPIIYVGFKRKDDFCTLSG